MLSVASFGFKWDVLGGFIKLRTCKMTYQGPNASYIQRHHRTSSVSPCLSQTLASLYLALSPTDHISQLTFSLFFSFFPSLLQFLTLYLDQDEWFNQALQGNALLHSFNVKVDITKKSARTTSCKKEQPGQLPWTLGFTFGHKVGPFVMLSS